MKRVAIVQSNYIPWKGYFDLIAAADEFIILDNVQFTKNDWRNRNRIKAPDGLQWLTIPVLTRNRFGQAIADTEISSTNWTRKHWNGLVQNYAKAQHFEKIAEEVKPAYETASKLDRLSLVNRMFIDVLCRFLDITTPIMWDSDYPPTSDDKEERVIELCHAAGATHYLTGPAARDYITPGRFAAEGLTLECADYSHYPAYDQPYPPFEHGVSILDLLFCTGTNASSYMYFGMGRDLGVVVEEPDEITGRNE